MILIMVRCFVVRGVQSIWYWAEKPTVAKEKPLAWIQNHYSSQQRKIWHYVKFNNKSEQSSHKQSFDTLCEKKINGQTHTKKRESKQVIIIAVLVLQFFYRWLFDWFAQAVVVHCLVYAWWYNPTPILGFTKLKFLFLLCVYKGGTMILCIPIPL